MAMARHLVLMRRNQQNFVISKAGRYFFTLCQPLQALLVCMKVLAFRPQNSI